MTVGIAGDKSGTDFDLLADLEDTLENRTTSDTTLQVLDLSTWLVDIERSNDNHPWVGGEVVVWWGDVAERFNNGVDVESELSRDGDDGRESGSGSLDKLLDALAVLHGLALPDQIHLVLEDDNVLRVDTNDFERGKMFSGLRLGTGFVTGDQEQGSVHCGSARPSVWVGQLTDGGTCQHGSHQNVVAWAIDERDVSARQISCG